MRIKTPIAGQGDPASVGRLEIPIDGGTRLQLGALAMQQGRHDEGLKQVRDGLAAATPPERSQLLEGLTPALKRDLEASVPAGTQTSANSR